MTILRSFSPDCLDKLASETKLSCRAEFLIFLSKIQWPVIFDIEVIEFCENNARNENPCLSLLAREKDSASFFTQLRSRLEIPVGDGRCGR